MIWLIYYITDEGDPFQPIQFAVPLFIMHKKMLQNHQCSNINSLVKRRVMPDKCSHKTGRNKKKFSFKATLSCIWFYDDDGYECCKTIELTVNSNKNIITD